MWRKFPNLLVQEEPGQLAAVSLSAPVLLAAPLIQSQGTAGSQSGIA